MKRRQFIGQSAGMITAFSLTQGMANRVSAENPDKPNIIFILTDDQRWDTLGCAGNAVIETPVMDSLAREGVRFANAFQSSPACAPSRACLLTGLYERTHGFTFGVPKLDGAYDGDTYPMVLRRNGYRTGYVGKTHVNFEDGVVEQMFDSFEPLGRTPYKRMVDGKERHLSDIMGDRAIDFIRESDSSKPFCLSLNFHAPHAEDDDPRQYIWPAAEDGLFEDDTIPYPSNTYLFNTMTGDLKTCFNRMRWWQRFCTPEKFQSMVKGHYRMITGVDRVVGRVRAQLESQGVADNTVIILMGDNGYFLGERGFGGKFMMYEQSLRVPLIVYDPRAPQSDRGKVIEEMALGIDIAPTIIDLAGIDIPAGKHGRSLLPLINGDHTEWRTGFHCEYLSTEFPSIIQSEGYRTEQWKYIRYINRADSDEFYDLANDPLEEHNLAHEAAYAGRLSEMKALCGKSIENCIADRRH